MIGKMAIYAERILGQQGDIVWMWVHDQPLALSARDATVVADRAKIEQANPGLAGLLPNERKFYTWMGELVVTLADARRVRIALPGFRAQPYPVADERQFSQANAMNTRWNVGYDTQDFGVRHGRGRYAGSPIHFNRREIAYGKKCLMAEIIVADGVTVKNEPGMRPARYQFSL